MSELSQIQRDAYEIAAAHGFHEARDIGGEHRDATAGERLALIASEVGEAVQALQKSPNPAAFYFEVDGKPEGVTSEIADVVIRCLDFAETYGFDLSAVIEAKMGVQPHATSPSREVAVSWGEPRGPVVSGSGINPDAVLDPRDRTERDRILFLAIAGLATDGGHHKQWYLEQIVAELEGDPPDHDSGIAP